MQPVATDVARLYVCLCVLYKGEPVLRGGSAVGRTCDLHVAGSIPDRSAVT